MTEPGLWDLDHRAVNHGSKGHAASGASWTAPGREGGGGGPGSAA